MTNYLTTTSILLEATQVGAGIKLGPKSNALMAKELKVSSTPAPDFTNDDGLTVACLEERGCIPYVKQAPRNKFICLFDIDGEIYVTKPCKEEAEALAHALYFLLITNKSVVTIQE